MKALVTGTAGFIGSHLSTALLAERREVVGIDAFTDYYPRAIKTANLAPLLASPRFHFVEAALQTVDLSRQLDGVTHVYHLAGQGGVRKSWGSDFSSYTSDNVDATQRLLESVRDRQLHRLVYASSSSLYGDDVAISMREDVRVAPV